MPLGVAARTYKQLFDGLPTDARYTDLELVIEVGGHQAYYEQTAYVVRVQTRAGIDDPNLELVSEEFISMPAPGPPWWRRYTVTGTNLDAQVARCVVVKMVAQNYTGEPQGSLYRTNDDQVSTADPPPFGMRIVSSKLYASALGKNITPEGVIGDIVSLQWPGERFFCPSDSGLSIGHLVFEQLPKDRAEGVEDVNALIDWVYEATKDWFRLEEPWTESSVPDEMLYTVSMHDPRVKLRLKPGFEDCFNAVRVQYPAKGGKMREHIEHGESETLGTLVRADVIMAPDSVRSKKGAQQLARKWLPAHVEPPVNGRLTLSGQVRVSTGEMRDVLVMRPGELVKIYDAPPPFNKALRITSLSKDWVGHTCDVEVGLNSRRFDRWLLRKAAKVTARR